MGAGAVIGAFFRRLNIDPFNKIGRILFLEWQLSQQEGEGTEGRLS